ncbi:MAG TPA: cytochrome c3 family protein, partial [Candidatus Polarisedimenticolia bacterium]|nr:cytochrome c3 family protein [Candidatus Polarisedimenticolia bacterium]
MKRWVLLGLFLAVCSTVAAPQDSNISQIKDSKHDFSVTSAATIKASADDQRCVFCHTPHNASPVAPLWNQTLSQGFTYQIYQSSTMKAAEGQPQAGDSSKLCLSCHDGTVALGDTVNDGLIPFQNVPTDQKLPPSATANIAGSSLSFANSHPFSFAPDLSDAQIRLPPDGDAVKLDSQGRVQCTSCHDPHNELLDPIEKRFLVKNNSSSAICTTCHVLQGGIGENLWSWSGTQGSPSSHSIAPNSYAANTNDGIPYLGSHTGYPTVATNGCESCHRPHSGQGSQELLKGETDQVCFQCHDGNPTTGLPDLKSEFTLKIYTHPSLGPQGGHDPAEAPDNILTRHAACDDCHNPHAARPDATTPVPPQLLGTLLGESGISETGGPLDPQRGTGEAVFEYEICLKCHSYNTTKPQVPGYQVYGPLPNRQLPSTDLRQAFTSTASLHPVINPRGLSGGPGGGVPSLLSAVVDGSGAPIVSRPLSPSSQIYCIDCHSSDTGRNL